MSKLIVKDQIKKGESFIGELDEVSQSNATFKTEKGDTVKVPLPKNILEILDEDYYSGDIIEINHGDDWEINAHDDWPESKLAK